MNVKTLYDPNRIERNPIPFDALDLRKFAMRKPRMSGRRVVIGFDSETLNGYAKLICASDGQYMMVDNVDQALDFLCRHGYRNTLNFWFNLQYDFDALAKWLPEDNLRELAQTNKTTYKDYKISSIPKKTFRIILNNNSYRFFDVAAFYTMSLEKAAKTFIGESKYVENVDRKRLGSDAKYWRDNRDKIIKYCLNDARLTARLAEILQKEIFRTCGFFPHTYVSKASVAAQYFRKYCDFPDVRKIPLSVQEMAFNNYFGGRFEVTERGSVGETTNLDIVSAYPYEIANLIDPTAGTWTQVTSHHDDADLGFYLCRVTVPFMGLAPLPRRLGQHVIFPTGSWGCFLSSDEIKAYSPYIDIQIVTGYEFIADKIRYPFKDAIEKLFARKQASEKGTMQYMLYKTLMNSLYGKFYEKIPIGNGEYKPGLLFNPVYASLITSRTRIKMWKMARRFGDRTVSLATDGLLVKGSVNLESNSELGGWEISDPAETIIIRSGMYKLGETMKQRGVMKYTSFNTEHGKFESIFDYVMKFPNLQIYPIISNRPRHLRECLQLKDENAKERINIFEDVVINLDISKDIKRHWLDSPRYGRDLLEKCYTSLPHDLSPSWQDMFPDTPMPHSR